MSNSFRMIGRAVVLVLIGTVSAFAQSTKAPAIPHAQDKVPNEPRDPSTAAKMMTVPDGFTVEVVASEPDIVNPVAMSIDERGRFWITESLEYPRRSPGVGQDRVKILEDTDGDGKADKFTVFLEGLNIPSGIAVGHGGVWIANSPDILFVQDTDGDGKADRQEVVVTGFGRTDTHELPNSLTWGPDGWLYGLNGVFNHSHVKYSKTNPNYDEKHPGWPLTVAMYRIHPRTREFQVFCEGTSNPWGIAFNDEGEAFISACVIDHLWHLTETGYYHRQGGPYPPYTWKMESIVDYKHQKAAYCGMHYFDSDAYPEQYRGKLYMGNIHGGCLNVDRVKSAGATYKGTAEPDFLTANDSWFMPVVQKTGPDGSLYILDWYDRYHCYQDANRDPAGIDRLKGRLYRVRYKETPRTPKGFNLALDSDVALIDRMGAKNDYLRDTARRLLQERNSESIGNAILKRLDGADASKLSTEHRRRLFTTIGGLSVSASTNVLKWDRLDPDPSVRAWRLRFLGDHPNEVTDLKCFDQLPWDKNNAREQSQAVIAASKLARAHVKKNENAVDYQCLFRLYFDALAQSKGDAILARLVWQNLHPFLETKADLFVRTLDNPKSKDNVGLMELMPRVIDRIVSRKDFDPATIARLIELLSRWKPETAAEGLGRLSAKVQNREIASDQLSALRRATESFLATVLNGPSDSPMYLPAAFLATSWNEPQGVNVVRAVFRSDKYSVEQRMSALNSLITVKVDGLVDSVATTYDAESTTNGFKAQILSSLSKLDDPRIATIVLDRYAKMDSDLQPRAIELLTQRSIWAKSLLERIADSKIPAGAINVNQARRLRDLKDAELLSMMTKYWGQSREVRDPNRDQYVAEMRQLIRKTPADPFAGERAFKKVCAQCHKIYGEGAEVGPDLTRNGRNDFNQLLSNVFDPSLVIGAGYRSFTVLTKGGRVLNGLLAEDSPQRVVLKVQGGKQEVIARDDVDEFKVSEISLMPEQLEKQLTPQEIVDLFAYLSLDKPPADASAHRLPGSGEAVARETMNAAEFKSLVNEILPGFTTTASGKLGVGIVKEHFGRAGVLRTHPIDDDIACVLTGQLQVPANLKTTLVLDVSHDAQGEWRLVVRANGKQMLKTNVSRKTCRDGWATFKIDLTGFAGQDVKIELKNEPDDREREFAYWGGATLVSE